MAANEAFASWGPGNVQASSALGYNANAFTAGVPDTDFRGIGFRKDDAFYLTDVVKVSNGATLTTGISVDIVAVDDGGDAADLGKGVVFGVSAKKLTSGTDDLSATGFGTEQTATLTLDATKGQVVIGTVTLANANLDSAAAGDHVAIKIRRVGSNAADTCNGRVIVLKATAYGY